MPSPRPSKAWNWTNRAVRQRAGRGQHATQRDTRPLRDGRPAFFARVPRDLRAAGEALEVRQRVRAGPCNATFDRHAVVAKRAVSQAGVTLAQRRRQRHVRVCGVRGPDRGERGDVLAPVLTREPARQQRAVRGVREVVTHPQQVSVRRRQFTATAARQQHASRSGERRHEHVAPGEHRSPCHARSPIVMARMCWRNPVATTITTCTRRNPMSATHTAKWIVRADCMPPNSVSRNGKPSSPQATS